MFEAVSGLVVAITLLVIFRRPLKHMSKSLEAWSAEVFAEAEAMKQETIANNRRKLSVLADDIVAEHKAHKLHSQK